MTNKDDQLKKDIQILRELQERMRKEYGWFFDGYIYPGQKHIEFRTHMLGVTFNHPNLQFTMPYNYADVAYLFDDVIEYIQKGARFLENEYVAEITDLNGRGPVRLMNIVEEDNPEHSWMRIIIADENGLFPDDPNCNPAFIHQLDLDLFENLLPIGAIQ